MLQTILSIQSNHIITINNHDHATNYYYDYYINYLNKLYNNCNHVNNYFNSYYGDSISISSSNQP